MQGSLPIATYGHLKEERRALKTETPSSPKQIRNQALIRRASVAGHIGLGAPWTRISRVATQKAARSQKTAGIEIIQGPKKIDRGRFGSKTDSAEPSRIQILRLMAPFSRFQPCGIQKSPCEKGSIPRFQAQEQNIISRFDYFEKLR